MQNDLSVGFDRQRHVPEDINGVVEACLSEAKMTAMVRKFAKSLKFAQYRPAKAEHEVEAAEGAMTKFLLTGSQVFAGEHVDKMLPKVEEFADLVHDIRGSDFFVALVRATSAAVTERHPDENRERILYVTEERLLDKCIQAVYAADLSKSADVLKQCQFTFCYIPGLDEASTLEETMTTHWTDESNCLTIKPDKVFASFLQMAGFSRDEWLAAVEEHWGIRLDASEDHDAPEWKWLHEISWRNFEDLPRLNPPITDILSVLEAVDNSPYGFTPCIAFATDAHKLMKRDWDMPMTIKGGVLGLTDFVNGTGDPIRFEGTALVKGHIGDCVLSSNLPNSMTDDHGIPVSAFKATVKDTSSPLPKMVQPTEELIPY